MPRSARAWLFQATPERYNLAKEMKRRKDDTWEVRRNRDNLRPGGIALLWQSGEKAGIYGLGELTSRVRDEDDEAIVDIRYTRLLDQPILKTELRKHPLLKRFGVIAMPRGKNPFRVLDKEWEALKERSPELRAAMEARCPSTAG
jgi:predicted RNA-binding protein with PUA-like domain